jgi:hypothetical protein
MHRLVLALVPVVAALATAAGALAGGSGGVTGPAIYVDGQLYRTVGTPTDFTGTGAPDSSFQPLWGFPDQPAVTTAAPGDPGFRGGRWMKVVVSYNSSRQDTLDEYDLNGNGVLDSAAEVEAALADSGPAGLTAGPIVAEFECPVIPLSHGH